MRGEEREVGHANEWGIDGGRRNKRRIGHAYDSIASTSLLGQAVCGFASHSG